MRLLNPKHTYFLLSISLHLTLVMLMICCRRTHVPEVILGDAHHPVIASYVQAEMPPMVPSVTHTLSSNMRAPVLKTPPLKEAIALTQQPTLKTERAPRKKLMQATETPHAKRRVQAQYSRGEATDPLLAILHAAIAREQIYPESALALERSGRVTVAFILQTNGQVRDLHIAQSSGTTSLDRAALLAVTRAAPFAAAETYLTNEQSFHIDVVFNLA